MHRFYIIVFYLFNKISAGFNLYTLLIPIFFFLGFSSRAISQTIRFQLDTSIPVVNSESDTLLNAWAGGINSPQYNRIKLNNDPIEDLVVFDRATYKVHTFIAEPHNNSYRWKYAPYYETQFPGIRNWMLLVDYDHDGQRDLFTYTEFGVQVFRNTSANGQLNWTLVTDLLMTESSSGEINLSVLGTDIPVILDIDNDGDVDLIAGDGIGHVVYYYQNQSMERTGSPNSLDFKTISRCWGAFRSTEVCGQFTFDITCGDEDLRFSSQKVEHAGTALLALDLNNDGLKELLFSAVSCYPLYQLTNTGTLQKAQMSSFTSSFPASRPISFLFPAAFYEDLNFDGVKDLIAAPNVEANSGNLQNFNHSSWRYTNTGTDSNPTLIFSEDNFLQNTMIDLGEMTSPALSDYDADGDLDLFIGNAGTPDGNGKLLGSIYLYENIGSKTQAIFQLKTSDYQTLSSLKSSNLKPFFLDWNRDGATDLVLMNTASTQTAFNIYLNQTTAGKPYQLSSEISQVISFSLLQSDYVPCFYDFDGDGDWDMLLGKSLGELEYYQNTGSNSSPVFTIKNFAFAQNPLDIFDRSEAPLITDWDGDGKPDLLSAYRNVSSAPYGGRIVAFPSISTNDDATFTPQANTIFNQFLNEYDTIPLPAYITPAAGDLNGDGLPELVLGTGGGGVLILKNTSIKGDGKSDDGIRLGPNPVSDIVYITTEKDSEVSVYNLLGKRLMDKKKTQANAELPINVNSWATGMYILKITNSDGTKVRKMIVAR
ncbi:T9SS type A sorting domain-containing protein [Xanthocytophaga agilis]|uniref:T9SS type A sorting domain-containing protein n=1 Tax=Xanthocytophaga agilis TaxID=3048010 RepID=A0AAE3R2A7_9BACT|nr:T9SS type A sorting domain-containing protein [Xanthocytophaga agilis]MDJ1502371.1 T9SS type A sorting domain-containing protein [Xanthocytophaga agilis]